MGEVGSDTRGIDDIVEGQFGDEGRCFEEKREGLLKMLSVIVVKPRSKGAYLSNSTSGTGNN